MASGDKPPETPDLCEVIPCPVCGGRMEMAYDREPLKICVCLNCLTSVSVPAEAWRAMEERRRASR
jgi:hypothetical protein